VDTIFGISHIALPIRQSFVFVSLQFNSHCLWQSRRLKSPFDVETNQLFKLIAAKYLSPRPALHHFLMGIPRRFLPGQCFVNSALCGIRSCSHHSLFVLRCTWRGTEGMIVNFIVVTALINDVALLL